MQLWRDVAGKEVIELFGKRDPVCGVKVKKNTASRSEALSETRFLEVMVMKRALVLFAASLGLSSPALADDFGYGHMMSDGGGLLMWFLILLVVAAIIFFVIQSTKSRDRDRSSGETALDILKKRYARGEIGKEEFDEKKAHLQQ